MKYQFRTILVPRESFFTEFAKEIAKKINSDDSDNVETCERFGYDLQSLIETLDSPLTDEEREWYEGLAVSLAKNEVR
tara:strand:- start:434 stop:667 length:234 start_codon:yes stop_codon:yes gene_type:complete